MFTLLRILDPGPTGAGPQARRHLQEYFFCALNWALVDSSPWAKKRDR